MRARALAPKNAAGAQGAAGPQGAAGAQGVPGVSGMVSVTQHQQVNFPPGQVRMQQVTCPGSKHALGGGFDATQTTSGSVANNSLTVTQSGPSGFDANGLPTAWTVTVRNDAAPVLGPNIILNFDLAVTAICVDTP